MNTPTKKSRHAWKIYFSPLPLASIFGIFFSLFLWDVFDQGTEATGIQSTAWLLLAVVIVLHPRKILHGLRDSARLPWIVVLTLLTLPFALFQNPFFENIHWLVFPVTLLLVRTIVRLKNPEQAFEGVMQTLYTFYSIGKRVLFRKLKRWPFSRLYRSKKDQVNSLSSELRLYVLPAVLTVALISIVSALLCAADGDFTLSFFKAIQSLTNLISVDAIFKVVVAFLLTFFILYCRLATVFRDIPRANRQINRNFIERWARLLLPCLILLYSWFLAAQIRRFSPDTLPTFFSDTEHLVKAGFWQLIAVGFINLVVTTAFFSRATESVRNGCQLLAFLSLGLLATAGYRVGLYALIYGLSYEKFYAAYTVLYCFVLFCWLAIRTLKKVGQAPLWMATKLAFAMYALIGIFPVERFIWETNMATRSAVGSRERLADMQMLSGDVLSLAMRDENILKSTHRTQVVAQRTGPDRWETWINEKESLKTKPWYEKTLAQIFF